MNFLVIGAHPDDAELMAGGTAILLSRLGHRIKFVSMTNGAAGHHLMQPEELANRRKLEAKEAAKISGVENEVLPFPDGMLTTGLKERQEVIRIIREFEADLVISHRPNDYHADHRATAQLVTDAAFLVNVPLILPTIKALRNPPIFGYSFDFFQDPQPFRIDGFVEIDSVIPEKLKMLDCHKSQFYEWLPFVENLNFEPQTTDRHQFLLDNWLSANESQAKLANSNSRYVEGFQRSEYGRNVSAAQFHAILNGAEK